MHVQVFIFSWISNSHLSMQMAHMLITDLCQIKIQQNQHIVYFEIVGCLNGRVFASKARGILGIILSISFFYIA